MNLGQPKKVREVQPVKEKEHTPTPSTPAPVKEPVPV